MAGVHTPLERVWGVDTAHWDGRKVVGYVGYCCPTVARLAGNNTLGTGKLRLMRQPAKGIGVQLWV